MSASAAPSSPAPATPSTIHGELARTFQEIFTVIVRIRTDRQSAQDADSFRAHVKRLLATADEGARGSGYDGDAVRLAVYAVVAFMDEAVMNSTQPMFAAWPRQPLQEEIFGDHMAGETFFRNLSELLDRQDSEALADLLEVYQLCLILGFRGRLGIDGEGEVHRFTSTIGGRIERIRGAYPPLAPSAGLPAGETVPVARDPWIRRLLVTAGVLVGLALGLYLTYRLLLGSGTAELRALTGGLT